jgi:hypothetical protein
LVLLSIELTFFNFSANGWFFAGILDLVTITVFFETVFLVIFFFVMAIFKITILDYFFSDNQNYLFFAEINSFDQGLPDAQGSAPPSSAGPER